MEIKKNIIFIQALLWMIVFVTHTQESKVASLPFKPLLPLTPFSEVLDQTIRVWSQILHGKIDYLVAALLALDTMVQTLPETKDTVPQGNLEYLLSIFDNIVHQAPTPKIQALADKIKRSLIDLL